MSTNDQTFLVSYYTVRKVIGLLGILLPIVLIINSLYCGESIENSISAYYYSNLGDVFVAILTALAMFLFSYKAYELQLDNWITNIAAFAALGVAFFPCNGISVLCVSCKEHSFSKNFHETVHYLSASIFFISLAILLLFYFTKSDKKVKTTPKKVRNAIYIICGLIMIACLLMIVVITHFNLFNNHIFWPESIALFAFGFAWLVKGELLLAD